MLHTYVSLDIQKFSKQLIKFVKQLWNIVDFHESRLS